MGPKPTGREAVIAALIAATTELIIERGLAVSVRDVASRAGVNHGLVHAYFRDKDAMVQAALDGINERAANDLTDDGFPPADLPSRRDGELAKAMARVQIESTRRPFTTHPISERWREALARVRPELPAEELDLMIAASTTLALGWAIYGDQLVDILGIDADRRTAFDQRIAEVVAELGGLPTDQG